MWWTDLHFLRPLWLLALLPIGLLIYLWWRYRKQDSAWQSSVEPQLLEVLLDPGDKGGRVQLWPLALLLVALVLGLSGPTWQRLPQPVEQANDALVIALDLSLSMYAQDIAPSRLVRAKQEIIDVLRLRNEGYTGLVAYAGSAHAVAPLTDDVRTIQNLLDALEPAMMPVQGSNARAAMEEVEKLFANARVQRGRILLVTDGIDNINDVSEFRNRAYPISVLGIGTPSGGAIPLDFVNQPGRFLQTQEGETITARLDDARLQQVAELTFGRYERQTLSDQDIETLLATPLPGDEEMVEVDREFDVWHDVGFVFALLALPLLLLGFRKGALVCLALVITPIDAHAGLWEDLWERRDQQGYDALRYGEPERAVTLFEDGDWQSIARYRSGDFDGAAAGFAAGENVRDTYNLGNALARMGDYRRAIGAYDSVLAREPEHEDAAFNKALVEKLLQEQEEASQQDNSEEQQDSEDNSSESERDSQDPDQSQTPEQEQDPNSESEQENDNQPQESEQSPDEGEQREEQSEGQQERDESSEAMEQWLRRVPDDPGGLLRRKFQYENQQRLRRGDYRNRQREKIW